MARCEDYPCCGHEAEGCPDYRKDGSEIWRCVCCGKRLRRDAGSSICHRCSDKICCSDWDERYDPSDYLGE